MTTLGDGQDATQSSTDSSGLVVAPSGSDVLANLVPSSTASAPVISGMTGGMSAEKADYMTAIAQVTGHYTPDFNALYTGEPSLVMHGVTEPLA